MDKRLRFGEEERRNDKSMAARAYVRRGRRARVRDKGAHSLSIKMVACDVDAGRAIISKNAIIARARLRP